MKKILQKIFNARQSKGQLVFAGVGFMLGLLLLLLSVHLYIKINELLAPNESASDYLIINKKVGMMNTLTLARADFAPEEIKEIEKQSFTKKIGLFRSNQFAAWAYGNEVLPIQTELFFEAVPDDMMGEIPRNWDWQEGQEFVPLVLSQEFLNLYNFGYALAKGLPQLSKSTISLAPAVRVELYNSNNKNKKTYINMKIVGFNDRIPTLLVPENFMKWANKNIGDDRQDNPARLIVQVNNPTDPNLKTFLESKDYQVGQDRLQASKAGGIIKVVMSVVGALGVLFVGLALVIFTMNMRLLLAEAKNEVQLLLQLGYTRKMLASFMLQRVLIFIGIITVLSVALLAFLNTFLTKFLAEKGFEISSTPDFQVWVVAVVFVGISVGVNILTINGLLKKF